VKSKPTLFIALALSIAACSPSQNADVVIAPDATNNFDVVVNTPDANVADANVPDVTSVDVAFGVDVSSAQDVVVVDAAPAEPKPDFSLTDVNATSSTFSLNVSPRDHLEKASAWYFGHST